MNTSKKYNLACEKLSNISYDVEKLEKQILRGSSKENQIDTFQKNR